MCGSDNCNDSLKNCFHLLKQSGRLRIVVPYDYYIVFIYYNHVKQVVLVTLITIDHKFPLFYKTFSHKLEMDGFKLGLFEYFDESGNFNVNFKLSDDELVKKTLIN
jgi:predicted SAM-dependent methyltransferase